MIDLSDKAIEGLAKRLLAQSQPRGEIWFTTAGARRLVMEAKKALRALVAERKVITQRCDEAIAANVELHKDLRRIGGYLHDMEVERDALRAAGKRLVLAQHGVEGLAKQPVEPTVAEAAGPIAEFEEAHRRMDKLLGLGLAS